VATVHVIVTCPPRTDRPADLSVQTPNPATDYRLPRATGFYSAGRFWPVGTTELDLDAAIVAAMEGEITRGESILTIQRVPGGTTAPAPRSQQGSISYGITHNPWGG
jgi:hypothetical protein